MSPLSWVSPLLTLVDDFAVWGGGGGGVACLPPSLYYELRGDTCYFLAHLCSPSTQHGPCSLDGGMECMSSNPGEYENGVLEDGRSKQAREVKQSPTPLKRSCFL